MKKWEYQQIPENSSFAMALALAGREGWEAYAVTQAGDSGTFTVWLKREIVQDPPPPRKHVIR